tara:strand:+ start:715 stop:1347 length:633 start_codon:yes stop_codon:yes gene_type:complete
MRLATTQIEQIFSANNDSAIFPILATRYYQNKLYKYSLRVCEIGLKQSPDNLEGLYVMAKTLLITGKITQAEKALQRIIKLFPAHLQTNLLLLYIYEDLNKNKNLLRSLSQNLNLFYPKHDKARYYYAKYCKVSSEKTIHKKTKKSDKKTKSSIFIDNPKLATPTMYRLLYSQHKYEEAYLLLKMLSKNPKHKNFVNTETKIINKKLKRG